MTPAEAMALQPPTRRRGQWFTLPPSARDWFGPGESATFWLPGALAAADELAGWDQLAAWDALVGRMFRSALFDEAADPRRLRKDAEAVAAVAESLAVRLGVER